jgi:hypothetical protein
MARAAVSAIHSSVPEAIPKPAMTLKAGQDGQGGRQRNPFFGAGSYT